MLDLVISNLLSVPVLAFLLGLLLRLLKSDLRFPEPLYQGLTLYLLFAIGLKGGTQLAASPSDSLLLPIVAAVALGVVTPFITFFVARNILKTDRAHAAALAAHYGSISAITFLAALELLLKTNHQPEAYLPALVSIMEVPGVLIGLILYKYDKSLPRAELNKMLYEATTNRSVILLIGGFFIGWIVGPMGFTKVAPFFQAPFLGVLSFFLLELGFVAAQKLKDVKLVGVPLVVFAVSMPLINGLIGLGLSHMMGLSFTTSFCLSVLAASSSYIAAPASVRQFIPEAHPSFYMTASLGITFPFNLAFGIPILYYLAQLLNS